jgi:pimeloyl-ACP methyl ester carboxylesterase
MSLLRPYFAASNGYQSLQFQSKVSREMQPPVVSQIVSQAKSPAANAAKPQYYKRSHCENIAYHYTPAQDSAKPIGVVFMGGFRSDMQGSKALALEAWCQAQGRSYLRFDYTGHGQSTGTFVDGCIGVWADDALSAFDHLTQGPQVLVGSSMGGWMALLVARERPERVKGLIGLAAAPDFTEDLMWDVMSEEQRTELMEKGQILEPNDYDPSDPTIITKYLIEDGRRHLLLRDPLNISVPVRLIQGMKDTDVPWATALNIQDALVSDDVTVQLVKSGDHRLSEAEDLMRLERTLEALLEDLESE